MRFPFLSLLLPPHLLPHGMDTRQSCSSRTRRWGRGGGEMQGRSYQSHKMAAAKFRLKAQSLIAPVYGALTSAWGREISEQGSKKKGKKTSTVSEEEVCPKATHQAFHCSCPLGSRHRASSLRSRAAQRNASTRLGKGPRPYPGKVLRLVWDPGGRVWVVWGFASQNWGQGH